MATGIVAVAAQQQRVRWLHPWLLVLAGGAYVVLAVVELGRVARSRDQVLDEMRSPAQAFGFLTIVAGAEVVAAGVAQEGQRVVAAGLAALGTAVALGVLPRVAETVRRTPPAERSRAVSGSWLLATVAVESIAVTAATLGVSFRAAWLPQLAAALWLAGLVVYVPTVVLLAGRVAREGLGLDVLAGDHWIVMGALAIAALAASTAGHAPGAPASEALRRSGEVLWIACIPLVVAIAAAEGWRARRTGGRIEYRLERWGTVFPLGMYAAAGHRTGVGAIGHVADVFLWIALAAWAATIVGFARSRVSDA